MKILEGIRVVEWTVFHVGPSAGVKLAEMGAEVIKLEEPGQGDQSRGTLRLYGVPMQLPSGRNWFFEFLNYGKKSVTLNLKNERGREAAYRLIEKSDVFFTNFRREATARLGLDYPTLRRLNPRLVYASSSCMGNQGPFGNSPGLEAIAQARSGMMWVTGEGDQTPQMIHSSVCDQTGSLMLTLGILAALLARERLGIGQEVTTSQLSGAMLLQIFNVMGRVLSGQEIKRPRRSGARDPLYNYYQCQDGRWMMFGIFQERYWAPFCRAIGHPEWIEDTRFADMEKREQNCQELIRLLDQVFASRPYAEWEKRLKEEDLLFSVVNTTSDLLEDAQVQANDYLPVVEHPVLGPSRWLLTPIKLSETPVAFHGPAPELGQHTEEVLLDVCGYSWEEVGQLREAGAI